MAQIGVVTKVDTVPAARDERMLTRFGLVFSCTVFDVSAVFQICSRVSTHSYVRAISF
jgi:hypothetical protein